MNDIISQELTDAVYKQYDLLNAQNSEDAGHSQKGRDFSLPENQYVTVTECTKCLRQSWYYLTGVKGITDERPQSKVVFCDGYNIEHELVALINQAGYPITDRQMELTGRTKAGTVIKGHIDGIIHVNGVKYLWECKSMNRFSFAKTSDNGIAAEQPAYFDQQQTYLTLLNVDHGISVPESIVTMKCKDTGEIHHEQIEWDPIFAEMHIHERADILYENLAKTNTPAPKDYDPLEVKTVRGKEKRAHWQCDYCNYVDICSGSGRSSDLRG